MKNINEPAYKSLISKIDDLPTIPASIAGVMAVLDNPDSTAVDLSNAISLDQSLTAAVLKTVNSPVFGFSRNIDSLDHAVALLGYRSIRDLILVTSIYDQATQGAAGKPVLDREGLWNHASACATLAGIIAEKTGKGDASAAFLAGLLHDVGKVFLDAYLHEEYQVVVANAHKNELLLFESEKQSFGATHADFGYWLAEEWNLPLNLSQAVIHHHDPSKAEDSYILVCIIHVADILARALEIGNAGDRQLPAMNRRAWSSLNMNSKKLENILIDFDREWKSTIIPH